MGAVGGDDWRGSRQQVGGRQAYMNVSRIDPRQTPYNPEKSKVDVQCPQLFPNQQGELNVHRAD